MKGCRELKIAYARVSTLEQNTDRQEIALSNYGIDKFFIEKQSGKDTDRPELKKMLSFVREGDVIYIESISRLARSTRDLINIIEHLKERGVALVSLKEAFNTSTPQGNFVLTIFAALSQLERETILQRQKEGIAAAKLRNTKFGRTKLDLPTNLDAVMNQWRQGEISAVEAMKRLSLKKTRFYELAKKYNKEYRNEK